MQEALTNIGKHARGTAGHVYVSGAAGSGLHISVRNRMPIRADAGPGLPGSGSGLLGRQERVSLAGGTLAHGPRRIRRLRRGGSTAMVRVLLVDDDAPGSGRAAGDPLLSRRPGRGRKGSTGLRAVAAVREHRPDVVLMDIRMPEMDGITATALLRRLDMPPEVIVLNTFHADDQVMSALRAGAAGFLLKHTPPAEIVNAVRLVASGEAMHSPSVTRTLLSHVGDAQASDRRRAVARRLATLTDREREVAVAVGSGASNAGVAASLFLSEATVKAHVTRLFAKLEAANRVQIAIVVHDADQA